MGISGNNKIRLVRKNYGNAVNEFNELEKSLREIMVALRDDETIIERNDTDKVVELCIDVRNDRKFWFEMAIIPAILQRRTIKEWKDLQWLDYTKVASIVPLKKLCKRYRCLMESTSFYDSAISRKFYVIIDNNGNVLVDAELNVYDEAFADKIIDCSDEELSEAKANIAKFNDEVAKGKKLIQDYCDRPLRLTDKIVIKCLDVVSRLKHR